MQLDHTGIILALNDSGLLKWASGPFPIQISFNEPFKIVPVPLLRAIPDKSVTGGGGEQLWDGGSILVLADLGPELQCLLKVREDLS